MFMPRPMLCLSLATSLVAGAASAQTNAMAPSATLPITDPAAIVAPVPAQGTAPPPAVAGGGTMTPPAAAPGSGGTAAPAEPATAVADRGQAEPATPPGTAGDGTAPGASGSTGWTGGTGGAMIGTNPSGAVGVSKTWQPPTARGLDLMGAPDAVPAPQG